MAWIVRPLATLTVLAGIIAAAFLSGPVTQSSEPPRARLETLAATRGLPEGWTSRAVDYLADEKVPLSRDELRHLVKVVDRASHRFGVDPLMVLAVIHVESRFDPFAVSEQGAAGLMQLQFDTARELAPRLGIVWTSDALLFDDEVNVTLGTYYLKQMLDRFDGNLDAALAAYESGPGRIESRMTRANGVPLRYSDRVWDAILALQQRMLA